jgi:transcriptional regulator with XRE-family HTH domain
MGYMSLKQQISHNLKRIRTTSWISQQKLADRTGLQVRYLSQLENHPKDISTRTLAGLDEAIRMLRQGASRRRPR